MGGEEVRLVDHTQKVEVQETLAASNADHNDAFEFRKYSTFGVASGGVDMAFSVYRWIGGAWRDTGIDVTLNSSNSHTYELNPSTERLFTAKRLLFILNSGTAGSVFVDLQR